MATSPVRRILPRLAIPAFGLVSITLLATFYVTSEAVYHEAMTAVMVLPTAHPFVDWEEIPAAIECSSKGFNVYLHDPCFTAVQNSKFDYSPLWLRLTFIRYADGRTNVYGLSLALLFVLSLSFLPSLATANIKFVFLSLSAISSATAFAMERGNADLIMFLMILTGLLACGSSRLQIRLVGYAVITLASLLKFYPMVALILVIRERPAVFATVALMAAMTLGGLLLYCHQELVQMAVNIPSGILFHPLQFGAKDLPKGLEFVISKMAMKRFYPHASGIKAFGRVIYFALLLLLTAIALMTALRFGRHCRLPHVVGRLDVHESNFLFAGATLICGCFFANENALYRGIFFLLVLPGLLALADDSALPFGRAVLRTTCGLILFVLWFPFVQSLARVLIQSLAALVHLNGRGMDRQVRFAMWLCDQFAWWWIIAVLLGVVGAFAIDSDSFAALFRSSFDRCDIRLGRGKTLRC